MRNLARIAGSVGTCLGLPSNVLAIVALVMILVVVFRATDPATRKQLAHAALAALVEARRQATKPRPELDRFREALRARTRWAIVTPLLIGASVVVFVMMARESGALAEPETLVRWGGNFWLRTRNGEWWRLVASVFVHNGTLSLVVNLAALAQIGFVLERLAGRSVVLAVFVAAGATASLVDLATRPLAMGVGASGAVFGLYGLLLASSIWTMRRQSELTMPLVAVKRFAAVAAVFVVFSLTNDSLGSGAELTGLLTGLICGAVLARGVSDRQPSVRRTGYAVAASALIVALGGIPLRGVTDVKPELEHTAATEARTAALYQQAVEKFRRDRMTADALATLIDRSILPELGVTDTRLKALEGVPKEHEGLVADAEEYVRLRSASWRLRAEWLRKAGRTPSRGAESALYRSNSRTIAQAEETERAALDALARISATP